MDNFLNINSLFNQSIDLLTQLIATPSFSGQEKQSTEILIRFFNNKKVPSKHIFNNIICYNKFFDNNKKTIILNSHHDTVMPNKAYTNNPFQPEIKDGKLYGLGSTDAGASVVSLIATFLFFYEKKKLPYNIILVISAEEEISGKQGIESILPFLPTNILFGIIGEPTDMQLAVSEKGLMVLDCKHLGTSGHVALLQNTQNPIAMAVKDLLWFTTHQFNKVSSYLGETKMNVTIINSGQQHNVVPSECAFTVDIRLNELYTHQEVLNIVKQNVNCEVVPRSMRLKSSFIADDNPIIKAGLLLDKKKYGSATMSDKALVNFPALKCGPGNSIQSHSADEFICLNDIKNAIRDYIKMLQIVFT